MCDWEGKEIPSKEEIDQLELKIKIYEGGKQEVVKIAIYPAGKRDSTLKRIKVVAEDVKVVLDIGSPYTILCWKDFDDYVNTL
ncbi:hypothetical protein PDK24_21915 [Bacillus cereus]|nr:hypothetical protein [Bacillus cereus]